MNDTILLKIMFLGMGGIIAGIFVLVALYYLSRMIKEKKYTCKTDGRIINNIRREERVGGDIHDRRVYWYSLCEYTVGDTKCVRQTNVGTIEHRKVGEKVTVYYNPNNCHESYIECDNNSGIKAIVALLLVIMPITFIYLVIKNIF